MSASQAPALLLALAVIEWCLAHDQPVPAPVAELFPADLVAEIRRRHERRDPR